MKNLEQQILEDLILLEQTVGRLPDPAAKAEFPRVMARLDQLTTDLPPETDPALLHYMRKMSYQKARLLLEGRDAENKNGNCRHD